MSCFVNTFRRRNSGVVGVGVLVVLWMFADTVTAAESSRLRGRIRIKDSDNSQESDLGRAIVFLDNHANLHSRDTEDDRPQIVQKNKQFVPNLLVVSAGTTVEFPNRDPYSHNVFSRSSAAQFDLDRYPQGVSKSYRFDNVGMVQLFCNIHPKMRAVILVVPNRHFARADAEGRFEVQNVPQGEYTLVAWHERSGSKRVPVVVGPAPMQEIVVPLVARPSRLGNRAARRRRHTANVERGLSLKRERLNLPVVQQSHPAPPSSR